MDRAQAMQTFWSSFGLEAYDENTVPDNAALPYITYNLSLSNYDETTLMSASIWYRSTMWDEITEKAEQISQYIGYGGKVVPFDGGKIWIVRGTPFSQRMSDEDDTIRRIYLNILAEYMSAI